MTVKEFDIQAALGSLDSSIKPIVAYSIGERFLVIHVDRVQHHFEITPKNGELFLVYKDEMSKPSIIVRDNSSHIFLSIGGLRARLIEEGILTE